LTRNTEKLSSSIQLKILSNQRTPELQSMSFPVLSALLTEKEARGKQGVLLYSGLRIEGASGFSVSIQGLMNVSLQWSSQCSWSDLTLPYSASINGKGFMLEQLVGGGIVLTLQRY
jgi:hypothetical protein